MFKKFLVSLLSLFLLSSCVDGFSNYFKRSANNKLYDRKGFQGGKRAPLYNKKYISQAKKNVIEGNLDDDDSDDSDETTETVDPAKLNRQMYLNMLKEDAKKRKHAHFSKMLPPHKQNDDDKYKNRYPSLNKTKNIVDQPSSNEQELQRELAEIKAMLKETKADLVKYKCPLEKK